MKKIISIVAILLCFATTYGQETKPTKQETMDWIAGKIKSYLNKETRFKDPDIGIYRYEFKNYLNNKIIISWKNESRTGKYEDIYTIDLEKITATSSKPRYDFVEEELTIYGKPALKCDQNNMCDNYFSIYSKWKDGTIASIIIFESEPNLFNRFIKALDALATFNRTDNKDEKY